MQAYDVERFDPPAPIAIVTVKSEELGIIVPDVPMRLDTGADVSLLPRKLLDALVTQNSVYLEREGFDGTRSSSPAVKAELQFLGKSFRGEFILIDGDYGILGRNILNHLSLLLDGRRQVWAEWRHT